MIITRAQWGAQAPRRVLKVNTEDLRGIVVHHTVTSATTPNGRATVKAIQNDHRNNNGWFDIAYSYLIDISGNTYEGRGKGVRQGATAANAKKFGSTQYANKLYYAVAFIGNFEHDELTGAAIDAFGDLRNELIGEGMGAEVLPHNHFKVSDTCIPGTLCPGANVIDKLDVLAESQGSPLLDQGDWEKVRQNARNIQALAERNIR